MNKGAIARMSEHTEPHSDELDLFEIIHTIWDGKVFIVMTTALGVLLGLATAYILPARYDLTVPFTINYHSLKSDYVCAGSRKRVACKQRTDFASHPGFAAFEIIDDQIKLQQSIDNEAGIEEPIAALQTILKLNSAKIFDEANDSLAYVINLNENGETTDAVIREIMKSHFIVRQYQNGTLFADLGQPEIKSSRLSPIVLIVLISGAFFILACSVVLFKNTYSNWENHQSS